MPTDPRRESAGAYPAPSTELPDCGIRQLLNAPQKQETRRGREGKVTVPPSVSALTPKKARRARSWNRGQARKQLRVQKQAEAEARNKKLRSRGELTPWEKSKAAAKARKAAVAAEAKRGGASG